MKIIITGGTGFLGQALARALTAARHDVQILSRRAGRTAAGAPAIAWTPDGSAGAWAASLDGAEAVVNLAGESIAGTRWSSAQKSRILESRRSATQSIAAAIAAAAAPPPLLVNGSAVGYYGPCGDEIVTEQTAAGSDFLARVCVEWEREAARAASARTRVVCIRTGLVLARDGGALPQMLPPFRFGAGGRVGSGRQYWPWIHRDDWVALVRWILTAENVSGPVNATAPQPVTNAEFARALGRAMHRPALMPAPAPALRLLLGEMADALLLSGQRAIPKKAEEAGFSFAYPALDRALAALFTG